MSVVLLNPIMLFGWIVLFWAKNRYSCIAYVCSLFKFLHKNENIENM